MIEVSWSQYVPQRIISIFELANYELVGIAHFEFCYGSGASTPCLSALSSALDLLCRFICFILISSHGQDSGIHSNNRSDNSFCVNGLVFPSERPLCRLVGRFRSLSKSLFVVYEPSPGYSEFIQINFFQCFR